VIYDFAEHKPVRPKLAKNPPNHVEHTTSDEQEQSIERSRENRKPKWNSVNEMLEQLFNDFEVYDDTV